MRSSQLYYFIHSFSNESTFQIAKYMNIIAVALLRHSPPSPLKSLYIDQRQYRDGNKRVFEQRKVLIFIEICCSKADRGALVKAFRQITSEIEYILCKNANLRK